jgi:hypothetical protein
MNRNSIIRITRNPDASGEGIIRPDWRFLDAESRISGEEYQQRRLSPARIYYLPAARKPGVCGSNGRLIIDVRG